jgi:putative heme-binding domain-containing protein
VFEKLHRLFARSMEMNTDRRPERRTVSRFFCVVVAVSAVLPLSAAHAQERAPWTSSRIQGTPEPPPPYRIERAFPNLTFAAPLDLVRIPGTDRVIVVEQRGRLWTVSNDEHCMQPDLLADFKMFDREVVECYGVACHPKFAENRQIFVWLNFDLRGKPTREDATRIIRFRMNSEEPPRLELDSAHVVFTWLGGGHNGGNVRFGPDGMLYISTGDAASPDPPDPLGTGQNIGDLLSSVLRIDVDHEEQGRPYAIPNDNPFRQTAGARAEVWAYGFRNPWRLSFDSKTGALWVGDVGWELWEMIYRVERGGNYGWSITEGGRQDVRPDRPRGPTPILPPAWAHPHEEAASITGGEVYHGAKFPDLEGAFIYGDWQVGTFWALRPKNDGTFENRELCRSTLLPAGFGTAPDGELIICDHGGGGLWRFARNPDATQPAAFPRTLAATGVFHDVSNQIPEQGVFHYEVNAARWADYATAERWVAFPGSERMTAAKKELGVMPAGRWVFPRDAVLAKTYSLEMVTGDARTRRKIETQILHHDGQQWAAYSYRWNDAQTDAELVGPRGAETVFEIKDPSAPGGMRRQTWRYFSRSECLRCHNMWNNFAPGFSPVQLDRVTADATEPQLEKLIQVGLALKPEPKSANPFPNDASLEARARFYLHANCSTCHRIGGGGSVPSMMNVETPLAEARLVGSKPVQGDLGLIDGRIIAPGDPARSALLYRMTTAGRGHMPYLGGRLVDDRGVVLVRDWIASMPRDENISATAREQRMSEEKSLERFKSGDVTALDPLLGSSSGALSVALAVIDGSLKGDVRTSAIARGATLPDPLRRDLFERFLPETQRRKTLGPNPKVEMLLTLSGDAKRGQTLFAALCGTCHRAADAGVDFGPDLTHISTKYNRNALLEQILHPSKVIDPAWHLAAITLQNDEAVSGFVSSTTDSELTVKLPGGAHRVISKSAIKRNEAQRVSLMPEGLLESLSKEEAGDLLQFLFTLK